MTQVTQSEINSAAWGACDTFRGVVDPSIYKDYVLTMLFLKYISDVWKDHHARYTAEHPNSPELVEAMMQQESFVLPGDASFHTLHERRHQAGNGERIDKALHAIQEANGNKLDQVFQDIHFMHLQGKDLVSLSTQRSARALMATALVILLAKHYAVLPTNLLLVGVEISQTAVSGATFWILGFQMINHIIHWWGDYRSIWSWNSREKVNGLSGFSAGSQILSKLDQTLEKIDVFLKERKSDQTPEGANPDSIAKNLVSIRGELSDLKPSIESYRTFGAFYFFGWFLAFPILFAVAAIFWPDFTETAILAPSVPFD